MSNPAAQPRRLFLALLVLVTLVALVSLLIKGLLILAAVVGIIATIIATMVTNSPLKPTAHAPRLPPGTRTVSGGASVRRCGRLPPSSARRSRR